MIDLIINLAMFFLVSFILLPCFVLLALSIRAINTRYQKHMPAELENRRARNSPGLTATLTSPRSSSSVVPCRTGEDRVRRLPTHSTPLHSN
jgi:hypothetical protein